MGEYTTTEVRLKVATVLDREQGWRQSGEEGQRFDRWLAAELAAAKAEAWDEAVEHIKGSMGIGIDPRFYRTWRNANPHRTERTDDA